MQLSDLIKQLKTYARQEDIAKVKKAYAMAERFHEGQVRASGEAYIDHPLHTAYTLAELKLDSATIAAALLHDTVEDTDCSYDDIKKEFGKKVAELVEGVTKIGFLKSMTKEERHAASIRKVILASIKDIRIILIKLADRVHNMQTLSVFRQEKRQRIAGDALEIYAPIAHKLGIATIKWQLEDLAFKQLDPDAYKEIQNCLKQSQKQREREIEKIKKVLENAMQDNKVGYKIIGRPKHVYSIYKKMQRKQLSFEDVYDLRALRIITDSVGQCYEVLGIIHNLWTPIPKEFDDYIANPKSNMYQSLHTVVIGPTSKPVEIQIRTEEMHRIAEEGIAAHWKYKGIKSEGKFDKKISWMKQVNEWQKESEDAKDFLSMLHIDFFEDEMFCFTPKGRVIELPKSATVLDFAFAVHSGLGMQCVAAKVNGHFVPLRWKLKNGDLIDIIRSKTQHPSRDWLKIVTTSKAKTKIKQYIRSTQSIPVKSFSKEAEIKKELEAWIIDVDNMMKPEIKLSRCCKPLPGEKIEGYATKTDKVSIHKQGCPHVKKYTVGTRRRKVNVQWMDNIQSVVEVKLDADERTGLFAEVLNTLIALNMPIKHAHAKPLSQEMVECSFNMEVNSIPQLQDVIARVKNIQGVKNVFIGSMSK